MKYIVEFEDEPCMYEDEVHFYKCIQAPWWGLSERVIKQLTPYQPDAPDTNVGNKISKFIDGIEEIFADIRERHGDDSVCGLCEYDGAYMGQSGDWCNECPGFDKDDCFKLSDETRKKWIEEIVNAYPDHTVDIGKKAEGDCISRQAAIDALDCINGAEEVLRALPSVQPDHVADVSKKVSISCDHEDDLISRRAAIDALDEQIEQCNKALGSFDISLKDEYAIKVERASLKAYKEQLENMPSTQPTLCGYNVEHLILIANVLRKENLPPERVAEALTDIGRIVSIVKDEFEESLRKAVEQCKV